MLVQLVENRVILNKSAALAYTFWPLARISTSILSIPSLSIIRMPLVDTRNLTKRFSDSTQKR